MTADLFTPSRDLEDIMLREYPGRIYEWQYYQGTSQGEKIYCFFELEKNELLGFVSQYKGVYDYEIRDEKGSLVGTSVDLGLPSFVLN